MLGKCGELTGLLWFWLTSFYPRSCCIGMCHFPWDLAQIVRVSPHGFLPQSCGKEFHLFFNLL